MRATRTRTSGAVRPRAPQPPSIDGEISDSVLIDWPNDGSSEEAPSGRTRRRNPFRWAKALVDRHLAFVARQERVRFVLAVGLWVLLLKPVLMGLSRLVELRALPEALTPLLSVRPLEWLTATATGALASAAGSSETLIAVVVNLLVLAVLLPLVATALAQWVPLHILRERVRWGWVRVVLSLCVMGVLYTLAFGRLGFFLTGVGLGVPLLWAFRSRLDFETPKRAFLQTFGAHAFANGAIVVFLVAVGVL